MCGLMTLAARSHAHSVRVAGQPYRMIYPFLAFPHISGVAAYLNFFLSFLLIATSKQFSLDS